VEKRNQAERLGERLAGDHASRQDPIDGMNRADRMEAIGRVLAANDVLITETLTVPARRDAAREDGP
jgi:hypothetical protein